MQPNGHDGKTTNHIGFDDSGNSTIVGSANLLRQQPCPLQLRQHQARIRQRSLFHTFQGQLFHCRHSYRAENFKHQLRREVSGEHLATPHQEHTAFQHLSVSRLFAKMLLERVSGVTTHARPQLQPRHRTI